MRALTHRHAHPCCTCAHKQGGSFHDHWLDLAGNLDLEKLSAAIDACQDKTLQDLLRRVVCSATHQ